MRRVLSTAAAALSIMLFAGVRSADAIPTPLPTASTSDASLILPGGNVDATLAAGAFAGNDKGAQGTALDNLNVLDVFNLGVTWSRVGGSDDGGNGPFAGNPNVGAGELELDAPLTGPFVLSLKTASSYSLYYFEDAFDATRIAFTTLGTAVNPQGSPKALSHASLFLTEGAPNNPPPNPPQGQVGINPEPTTALLGMIGFAALAMRRREAAR